MTRAFLPDYSQMAVNGRYRPLFKLFAGENWRMVRAAGAPVECRSAGAAIAAAKAHVERILNPKIHAEAIPSPVTDALADEAQAFLQRREAEIEAERASVFGAQKSTIYMRGGRTVAVETKRRRA